MAKPVASVWRVLSLLWRPLRRLTEETRQQRLALEAIARELKAIRLGMYPEPEPLPPDEEAVEVGFTTDAEQAQLELIYRDLTQLRGGTPPSEEDILQEYARRLDLALVGGQVGSLGLSLRGRRDYIDEPPAAPGER